MLFNLFVVFVVVLGVVLVLMHAEQDRCGF